MATERHTSSFLAKLMGIDRPSTPDTIHQRHRILSENYLQNIASVAYREKAKLHLDENDCNMDVDELAVELSQRVSTDECQNMLVRCGKSFVAGSSFSSPSSLSGGRKQKTTSCVTNKGTGSQKRGMNSLYTHIGSPIPGSVSPQGIANQITSQIKHSFADVSTYKSSSDKSSTNELKETISSAACLFDLENKCGTSSFNPINSGASIRWRIRTCSEEARYYRGSKIHNETLAMSSCAKNHVPHIDDVNLTTLFNTSDVNSFQVSAARYLSKPTVFPSAWVPRNRTRHFFLDRNWCLRPGERDSKQCNDSTEDNFSLDVGSTSKTGGPSLNSEKQYVNQEASSALNDSIILEEQLAIEEIFTACESVSERSAFSDIESPTYQDVSQGIAVVPLSLNCNVVPLCIDAVAVTGEGNDKMKMSTKFQREQLSAKPSTCILLDQRESRKFQLKNKNMASEPGSPVSSLEGPEACRCLLNITAESEDIFPVSGCLENDVYGLQTTLQVTETRSLESGSDGPWMVVSSEEGDEGDLIDSYQKDPQIMEVYQKLLEENRDFSYLVDFVEESGFRQATWRCGRETWCSWDYVLDPVVFDLLEEKHGKRTIWERSERRLLFDRINSGLLEIVQPIVGTNTWRRPVVKRFGPRQSQELIEEVLWALLLKQEEEFKRESFDKVFRREKEWLELEEDICLIVEEVQSLLIDELIGQFMSMEICF